MAELGEAGEEFEAELELKLLADVGLVGFPNAGKSTFLSVVSNARPEMILVGANAGDVLLPALEGFVDNIARSQGMTTIAKKTGLNRSNLYHSFNKDGNLQISTVSKLIKSFG